MAASPWLRCLVKQTIAHLQHGCLRAQIPWVAPANSYTEVLGEWTLAWQYQGRMVEVYLSQDVITIFHAWGPDLENGDELDYVNEVVLEEPGTYLMDALRWLYQVQ